jgi:hypothetical protein
VANNIVVSNGGPGISEQGAGESSTGTHNKFLDNLVDGNSDGSISLQNDLTAAGTLSASPEFVNYTGTAEGNYHLQSSSPAETAGTPSGAPSTDFDGDSRLQDGPVELGAY